jgi:SAM-dependent methyltransferase
VKPGRTVRALDCASVGRRSLLLPARGRAPKPDADDPVDYYYRPLTAALYRGRLRVANDLLGGGRFETLLEVGYGSGIYLPELSLRADRIVAIDIHGDIDRVRDMLGDFRIDADLRQGSLFEMPFPDASFDALVCLSVLEHLRELDAALDEFRRVLREGGIAVLGFPVRNVFTDRFFRLVGYDPREIHPSSHDDILAAARRSRGFAVEREAHMPALLPLPVAAYAACRLRAVAPVGTPAESRQPSGGA